MGVPETFIVDREGVLRKKFVGAARLDSPQAIGFIRDLLSAPRR